MEVIDLKNVETITLYEKLGGKEGIEKVVDYFYEELVLKDEAVNHFFIHTDMKKQKKHQTAFISFATGEPNNYSGNSMKKAHEHLSIAPEHFMAIVNHLIAALRHFNVGNEDIDQVVQKLAGLKEDVITKQG